MKNEKENLVKDKHDSYDNFLIEQYIVDLDKGDKVKIQILDKNDNLLTEKEFIAKQVNCHINCTWQDKGIKKTEVTK